MEQARFNQTNRLTNETIYPDNYDRTAYGLLLGNNGQERAEDI